MKIRTWELLNVAIRIVLLFGLALLIDGPGNKIEHFALVLGIIVYLAVMIVKGMQVADTLKEMEKDNE